MKNDIHVLENKLNYLFKKVPKDCLLKFSTYINLLRQWNKRTNLISRNDEKHIVERHILESIAVFDLINIPEGSTCLDLGSGAGFPGIPIKIVRPDLNMTFLDSKRMKCLFLKKAVQILELSSVLIICERVEKLNEEIGLNTRFDLIFVRAVSDLAQLWKWSAPLLKDRGRMLAWKGGKIERELELLKQERLNVAINVFSLSSFLVNPLLNRKLVVISNI